MNAESTRNLDEILSTEQLEAFQSRVAQYDENNEFLQEDFGVAPVLQRRPGNYKADTRIDTGSRYAGG